MKKHTMSWLTAFLLIATCSAAASQPLEVKFSASDPMSKIAPDHALWEKLLNQYVKIGQDGVSRVNYRALKDKDSQTLRTYLTYLQSIDVSRLNKSQQFAFWVNLYNAKTVELIVQHYPVKSIKDIDISPGLFANGPWGKKLVIVNDQELSLDDIEHKILRPIWKDPRIHYAVNCASIGCPNLVPKAYIGNALEEMLDQGARGYINSPRGVSITNGSLTLSKIFSWYQDDFGASESDLLRHIRKYAGPKLRAKLKLVDSVDHYAYNWSLNDAN